MNEYFAFQWHILDDCDQRCRHCYIFSTPKNELHQMSMDSMELVVENCLEMCEKSHKKPYFAITGGDPLLHPDFWNLLGKLSDLNLDFSVMGNPHHLTDDVCRKLKKYGCRQYQMSLDGLRKTHDEFRQPGSFDLTLEKIKVLQNAGIKTSIMTTVSKMNMNQIPWIIDEVVRARVDLFSFARYCPEEFSLEDHMTPDEYRKLLEKIWDKFHQYRDFHTLFSLKDHLWNLFV